MPLVPFTSSASRAVNFLCHRPTSTSHFNDSASSISGCDSIDSLMHTTSARQICTIAATAIAIPLGSLYLRPPQSLPRSIPASAHLGISQVHPEHRKRSVHDEHATGLQPSPENLKGWEPQKNDGSLQNTLRTLRNNGRVGNLEGMMATSRGRLQYNIGHRVA